MNGQANNKDDKAKCPRVIQAKPKKCCNKDHRVTGDEVGDSKGKSSKLAAALNGPENDGNYDGPGSLAAHHLICCQLLNGKHIPQDQKDEYEMLCHAFGYDINGPKNGVLLPTKMYLACLLKLPLHRSNHDSGETLSDFDATVNPFYPEQVEKLVEPVIKKALKGDFCKEETNKKFVTQMNARSDKIRDLVMGFKWLLTADGLDYKDNHKGCCNEESIPIKLAKALTNTLTPCNRNHSFKTK